MQQPNETPEQNYLRLLKLWNFQMHASDPDQQRVRELHKALALEELLLYDTQLDRCLTNLDIRLRAARQLGFELPLPLWAAQYSERLLLQESRP
jgi:hypothetical protein